MSRSHIAGILNSYGGVRVVVAHRSTFKQHIRCGEFLCVVRDKTVREPIAWGDIPYVIRFGEIAVEDWIKRHERDNDPDTREAIRAYRTRKLWHPEKQGALDLSAIVYT